MLGLEGIEEIPSLTTVSRFQIPTAIIQQKRKLRAKEVM